MRTDIDTVVESCFADYAREHGAGYPLLWQMARETVAGLALENIDNGPVLICSEHYKAVFEQLLALPRRQALTLMAGSMKTTAAGP